MQHTKISASVKMSGTGIPERDNSGGRLTVGESLSHAFPVGSKIFCRRVQLCGSAKYATCDLAALTTSGSHAYVAPTQQRRATTVSGTVTAAGNAKVTVTGAGYSAPVEFLVPVAVSDNATAVATKIFDYVGPRLKGYTLLRAGAALELRRVVDTVYGYPNDATMDLAVENGSSTGLNAVTSTTLAAGAVATGVIVDEPNAEDAEGLALPVGSGWQLGVTVAVAAGQVQVTDGDDNLKMPVQDGWGQVVTRWQYGSITLYNLGGGYADATLTVVYEPSVD